MKSTESVYKSEDTKKPAEKPVSLRPLKFEAAVAGLLKTRPSVGKVRPANRREIDDGGEADDGNS